MSEREGRRPGRLRLGFRASFRLFSSYTSGKLKPKLIVFASLLCYLLAFQVFVLGRPVAGALAIAGGTLACAIGITVFLEGIFLGIMPLGESCGLSLPLKAGPVLISIFALVMGVTATLAEPAIAYLRTVGASVKPWQAPVLHFLLNRGSWTLVIAIAMGVGAASALGALRFLKRWSFKPILFPVIAACLAASALASRHPELSKLLGLAWDSGGITTGPVTVPLVLALGIGMSRASGGRGGGTEGFGLVTIASLLPVIAVLALGLIVSTALPSSMTKDEFFSEARRAEAIALFGDGNALASYARESLDPESWKNAGFSVDPGDVAATGATAVSSRYAAAIIPAVQAVIPLSVLLVIAMAALRRKIRQKDELILGIAISIAGMALFNAGMAAGPAKAGAQAGAYLPSAYMRIEDGSRAVVLEEFDEESLVSARGPDGTERTYLMIEEGGNLRAEPYLADRYEKETRRYLHAPTIGPLFTGVMLPLGFGIALLFAFVLGIGATFAEPSLSALGAAVEEASVGTVRSPALVRATAIGVGIGMSLGFARAMTDIPLIAFILPVYAVLIVLTVLSDDAFASLAWDAAGVTTGPITVPLVISTGLGISARVGSMDSFGILACASAIPIATVLILGLRSPALRSSRNRPLPARSKDTK